MADIQGIGSCKVKTEKQILPEHTVAYTYIYLPPQPQPGKASALKPCWLLAKSIVGRRHLACTKRQLAADKLFKIIFIYISIQYDPETEKYSTAMCYLLEAALK